MMLDWGDGEYEVTAARLEPVAEQLVLQADIGPSSRVLDAGCGTGNVALAAARRGARVDAFDPSQRLLAEAARRCTAEALDCSFSVGSVESIAQPDETYDRVLAVFSVIFAENPPVAIKELLRVAKHGARILITSWPPEGAIEDLVQLALPPEARGVVSPWATREGIEGLLSDTGADLHLTQHTLTQEAASAEEYFAELERTHPAWRRMRQLRAAEWDTIHTQSCAILEAANEQPGGLRISSRYWLIDITRH